MSQIYKSLISGPVPPAVPTSFTTDIRDNNGSLSPGTSIPAANNLEVLARYSSQNNVNGIRTDADPNNGKFLYVELTNRVNITATTSDGGGQTQTIVLLAPANSTSITFRCLVTGYDSANNISIGGEQIGLVRTAAGIVSIVGTNDTFDESDAALNTADWNVISASPNLSFTFVGVAGHTIVWRALFEYTQAP